MRLFAAVVLVGCLAFASATCDYSKKVALIADAGSSGTRIYVVSTENPAEVLGVCTEGGIQDTPSVLDSAFRSPPRGSKAAEDAVKLGKKLMDTCKNYVSGPGAQLIESKPDGGPHEKASKIKAAIKTKFGIQDSDLECVLRTATLFVGATAGARQLGVNQNGDGSLDGKYFWDSLREGMNTARGADPKAGTSFTMEGRLEALFGYVASILTSGGDKKGDIAVKEAAASDNLGFMEMGGASVQVCVSQKKPALFLETKARVDGPITVTKDKSPTGNALGMFCHSFLGNANNRLFVQILNSANVCCTKGKGKQGKGKGQGKKGNNPPPRNRNGRFVEVFNKGRPSGKKAPPRSPRSGKQGQQVKQAAGKKGGGKPAADGALPGWVSAETCTLMGGSASHFNDCDGVPNVNPCLPAGFEIMDDGTGQGQKFIWSKWRGATPVDVPGDAKKPLETDLATMNIANWLKRKGNKIVGGGQDNKLGNAAVTCKLAIDNIYKGKDEVGTASATYASQFTPFRKAVGQKTPLVFFNIKGVYFGCKDLRNKVSPISNVVGCLDGLIDYSGHADAEKNKDGFYFNARTMALNILAIMERTGLNKGNAFVGDVGWENGALPFLAGGKAWPQISALHWKKQASTLEGKPLNIAFRSHRVLNQIKHILHP